MSTPVASRCWTVSTRTKPDSGAVDSHVCFSRKSSIVAGRRRHAMPAKPPAGSWVRCQSPILAGGLVEAQRERPLLERAGDERGRLVERVAEAGVDVPGALRVVVGRQAR